MAVLPNFRRLSTTQQQSNQRAPSSNTATAQSRGAAPTSIHTRSVFRIFASDRSSHSGSDPSQTQPHELDRHVHEPDSSKKPRPRAWSYVWISRYFVVGSLLVAMSYLTLSRQYQIPSASMNVLDSDFEQSYPDLTVLPTRTYPANEKFLLMDYSPWLGFNNMRYSYIQ